MQRDVRLRGLSSDHHRALVLVRTIRTALDAHGDMRCLARMIAEEFELKLNPHFLIEEEYLLPHLADTAHELFERTLSEHRELRSLAAHLRDGTENACKEFAEGLERHVRFEERELFPACEQIVPQPVLEEVARAVPHR